VRPCLAQHGVTHVFNSWDAMPAVSEQKALPGSRANARLAAARFLLKPQAGVFSGRNRCSIKFRKHRIDHLKRICRTENHFSKNSTRSSYRPERFA
jgi:hypothetical protein